MRLSEIEPVSEHPRPSFPVLDKRVAFRLIKWWITKNSKTIWISLYRLDSLFVRCYVPTRGRMDDSAVDTRIVHVADRSLGEIGCSLVGWPCGSAAPEMYLCIDDRHRGLQAIKKGVKPNASFLGVQSTLTCVRDTFTSAPRSARARTPCRQHRSPLTW